MDDSEELKQEIDKVIESYLHFNSPEKVADRFYDSERWMTLDDPEVIAYVVSELNKDQIKQLKLRIEDKFFEKEIIAHLEKRNKGSQMLFIRRRSKYYAFKRWVVEAISSWGVIQTVNELVLSQVSKVEALKEKLTQAQTEQVSILAIFTGITIAASGSLQILGNIFKASKLDELNDHGLGVMLISGGIFLILVYFIILSLVSSVHRIIKSRNFDGNYQNFKPNWLIFGLIIGTAVVLIGTGISLYCFK